MQNPVPQDESIFFASVSPEIMVLRIHGRGSHLNSPALQQVVERRLAEYPNTRFVIDMANCSTMDSTFMGALAGITLRQSRAGQGKATIVNLNPQARRLLDILGLTHVLDVREAIAGETPPDEQFEASPAPQWSKLERTVHMIQSHETLVHLDDENEVKFEGVLHFLRESLEREKSRLNSQS
ncbi:MAG: STAS domain protein [candidate division BRC1 bacterium ADurb.BinA364]|nr:MAG: STAS domain protein [candidate division BRC1 bacterium ADurb.BinA364]